MKEEESVDLKAFGSGDDLQRSESEESFSITLADNVPE